MSKPIISVIVPVYKVERYIKQCVDSIINQSYNELEIILIDDGSPDNCPLICDDYAKSDSRIKVIHKQNGGLASARNAGLDAATGQYVAFVDSDDWIDKTTYEEMFGIINKTGASIVCCDGIHTDGNEMFDCCFHCKPDGTVLEASEVVKEILLDKIGSQVVKGLYERDCWKDVRFPEGRLYEDIPVTFRAFAAAKKVAYINKPFYKYRINPKSISGAPNPIKPYHIFLGFKDHYDFAVLNYPEISNLCLNKACHYAVSTYFHYCTDGKAALSPYVNDVCLFLKEHKKEVEFEKIRKSRRFALKAYYFSNVLFKVLCTVFYKTGLQKALHFDIK